MTLNERLQKIGALAHELVVNYTAYETELAQAREQALELDRLGSEVSALKGQADVLRKEVTELEGKRSAINTEIESIRKLVRG